MAFADDFQCLARRLLFGKYTRLYRIFLIIPIIVQIKYARILTGKVVHGPVQHGYSSL